MDDDLKEKIVDENDDLNKSSEENNNKENKNEENNSEEIKDIEEPRRAYELNNRRTNKKKIITIILFLSVVVLSIIGFFVFNKLNTTKVYHNVYLSDTNMSSKTEKEVKETVESLKNILSTKQIHILNGNTEIGVITAEEIDLKIDVDATVSKIMNFGRDKGIILDNFNIFKTIFNHKIFEAQYSYSESKLSVYIDEITKNLEGAVVDDSYTLDETNYVLVITKGKSGKSINSEKFASEVLTLFKTNKETNAIYKIVIEERKPRALDIDVVYSKVKRTAADATIDESGDKPIFTNHIVGLDFNKEDLKNFLEKAENNIEGKIIKYNLIVSQPKVKLADIKWDLYNDIVSSFKTYFTTYDRNRVNNLRLGLGILDGTVVMPGETFSFNNTLGACTSAQGFLPASTFKNGKVVKEVGGGICQIASTLYNAALYANLEIKERKNHGLPVGYVPASRDATVYYPYVDLKFKNTRNYPIKIETAFNAGGSLSISIMGTKEEIEYEVILTSWKTGIVPVTVVYQNDSSLEAGKTKVIQQGTKGYTSVAYKEVKLNGKQISKTLLSTDKYYSTQTVIARGIKAVPTSSGSTGTETTPTPTPTTPVTTTTEDTTPVSTP